MHDTFSVVVTEDAKRDVFSVNCSGSMFEYKAPTQTQVVVVSMSVGCASWVCLTVCGCVRLDYRHDHTTTRM